MPRPHDNQQITKCTRPRVSLTVHKHIQSSPSSTNAFLDITGINPVWYETPSAGACPTLSRNGPANETGYHFLFFYFSTTTVQLYTNHTNPGLYTKHTSSTGDDQGVTFKGAFPSSTPAAAEAQTTAEHRKCVRSSIKQVPWPPINHEHLRTPQRVSLYTQLATTGRLLQLCKCVGFTSCTAHSSAVVSNTKTVSQSHTKRAHHALFRLVPYTQRGPRNTRGREGAYDTSITHTFSCFVEIPSGRADSTYQNILSHHLLIFKWLRRCPSPPTRFPYTHASRWAGTSPRYYPNKGICFCTPAHAIKHSGLRARLFPSFLDMRPMCPQVYLEAV